MPVLSDRMEPLLRRGRDAVVYVPCSRHHYDALYVLDVAEELVVYRCQRLIGSGQVRLISDNKAYSDHDVTVDEFMSMVRGKVVAEIRSSDGGWLDWPDHRPREVQ